MEQKNNKIKLYLTQYELDSLYLITGKIRGGFFKNNMRNFFQSLRENFSSMVSPEVFENYMKDRDYYCQGDVRIVRKNSSIIDW